MRRLLATAIVPALAALAIAAQPAGAATAEDFGFPATPVEGERPLLTVLYQFSDVRFDPGHTGPFYRDLLFATRRAPVFGRVAGAGGAFEEYSQGRFFYRTAGVIGPFTDSRTYATAGGLVAVRTRVIQAADSAGFPFDIYDTNDDGRVTTDELTILEIFAEPPDGAPRGGKAQPLPCVAVRSGKQVCTYSIGAGEAVGAATLAHEFSHTLGTVDVYGWASRLNAPFSLMAGTIVSADDSRAITHLDPYHKMRLGWLRPEVVPLEHARCLRLRAAEGKPPGSSPQAYLLHSAEDLTEYYLVEHRLPTDFNYDGDPWFTGTYGLPDQGLAIWYVKTDAAGNLLAVAPYDGPSSGEDRTLYLLPVAGTPGRPTAGTSAFWSKTDGIATATRLNTSTSPPAWEPHPSGATLAVDSDSVRQYEIIFRLNRSDCGVRPPPPPGPPPRTLPGVDEHPCLSDQGLREIRCRLESEWFDLERQMPARLLPGETITVAWTLRARRDVPHKVHVHDALPPGLTAVDKTSGGSSKKILAFGPMREGETLTQSYEVRISDAGVLGLMPFPSVVRFEADRKAHRLDLQAAVAVWSAEAYLGAEEVGFQEDPPLQPTEPMQPLP